MNKQLVFAVFDSAVSSYFTPFNSPSLRDAKDSFAQHANDPGSKLCLHPNDYSLMELGVFDSSTGVYSNLPAPVNHGLAAIYKQQPREENTLPFPVKEA